MALKDRSLNPDAQRAASPNLPLHAYDTPALLALRAEIDNLLGIKSIADIDLGHELASQLFTTKLLQRDTLNDPDVPPNQKAQTSNSLQAVLKELIKMRTDLYNAERARAIENFVVQAFTKCDAADLHAPAEVKEVLRQAKDIFFEAYEALLATHKTEIDE